MSAQPEIGAWYRLRGGDTFEVVAIDEDDGTIELQSFDGTVEEMDIDDWDSQCAGGEIEPAEAPEDWTGSVDFSDEESAPRSGVGFEGEPQVAAGLEGLDLFDPSDQFN
jgi:hypothetical protein